MLFSQRKGLKPVRSVMQIDSIDLELRNGLWNALTLVFWEKSATAYFLTRIQTDLISLTNSLWQDYFKKTIDSIPDSLPQRTEEIKRYFFKCEWYEVYDFLEFLINTAADSFEKQEFMAYCNALLKREMSAYRFVDGTVSQITSEEEIAEIELALQTETREPAATHLSAALELLSSRTAPDYRNSIKESISAVESTCNLLSGSRVSLGQALKHVGKTNRLHPALTKAFENLYGYTSDAGGIRHALLEEDSLDFGDAKFMLVVCSAFINYLRSKSTSLGGTD